MVQDAEAPISPTISMQDHFVSRRKCERSLTFAIILFICIFVNFDSGGTPSILVKLRLGCEDPAERPTKYDMGSRSPGADQERAERDDRYPCFDDMWGALLGAAPYVGIVLGCPVAEYVLQRDVKPKLVAFTMANSLSIFAFAFMNQKAWMVVAKFITGFTHAPIVVYSPIWIAAFAPVQVAVLWFALQQSSAVFGPLVGYATVGTMSIHDIFYSWGFSIQAALLALAAVTLMFIPARATNTSTLLDQEKCVPDDPFLVRSPVNVQAQASLHATGLPQTGGSREIFQESPQRLSTQMVRAVEMRHNQAPPCSMLKVPLKYPLFGLLMCALSTLYFAVTFVQYWIPTFFRLNFKRDELEVNIIYCVLAGTSPVLGLLGGSIIIDRCGGLKGQLQMYRISKVLFLWTLLAVISGLVAGYFPHNPRLMNENVSFYIIVSFIWIQLFFGGAIMPGLTSMSLEAVRPEDHVAASSASQLFCNVFGFVAGTLMPGYVNSQAGGGRAGMKFGFTWPLVGLACIATAVWLNKSRAAESAACAQPRLVEMGTRQAI